MLEPEGTKFNLGNSLFTKGEIEAQKRGLNFLNPQHSFVFSFILQIFIEGQPGVKPHSKQSGDFHKLKSLAWEMDVNRTNSHTV